MSNAALQFGGVERFAMAARQVFDAVTDLALLARVLPDVEASELPDAATLRCVVRPGFAFLRGKLNVTIAPQGTASDSDPLSVRFRVDSQGIGAQIVVESSLRVEAVAGETGDPSAAAASNLHWQAIVTQRKGLVATVSTALIRAAAEKVIQRTWQRLHDELSA